MWTSTSSASGSTVTVADDGVDPALGLGDRHPLHPVGAALVLHAAPHVVALDQERDLVEPAHVGRVGAQHLQLPALALGVAGVHVEQVLGEEVGLLAALGPPDLDDHVLVVVGVAGQEQAPAAPRRARRPWPRPPRSGCGRSRGRRRTSRPACPWPPPGRRCGPQLAEGEHDRLQLLEPPGHLGVGLVVAKTSGSPRRPMIASYSASSSLRRSSISAQATGGPRPADPGRGPPRPDGSGLASPDDGGRGRSGLPPPATRDLKSPTADS